MKNIALIIILLCAASWSATTRALEVYGNLAINGEEIILTSFDGIEMKINASQVRINDELEGLFKLRPNTAPAGTFTLVEVKNNASILKINHVGELNNIRRDEIVCAEIYQPVCGRLPMTNCPQGMLCAQVMPLPQTFGNLCEMKAAGASLIHRGECSEVEILGNASVNILPKRHPSMFR